MNINTQEIADGSLIVITFDDQYSMCSTMLRIQEHYESPYDEIRDKVFSIEKFMDTYSRERGNFTYTMDWGGYNVPDLAVRSFFEKFEYSFSDKEWDILEGIGIDLIASDEKFYVIGVMQGDDEAFDHELAHAFFHLDGEYRVKMLDLISKSDQDKVEEAYLGLKRIGYTESVYADELQAWQSTSDLTFLKSHTIPPLSNRDEFVELYKSTKRQNHDEETMNDDNLG